MVRFVGLGLLSWKVFSLLLLWSLFLPRFSSKYFVLQIPLCLFLLFKKRREDFRKVLSFFPYEAFFRDTSIQGAIYQPGVVSSRNNCDLFRLLVSSITNFSKSLTYSFFILSVFWFLGVRVDKKSQPHKWNQEEYIMLWYEVRMMKFLLMHTFADFDNENMQMKKY